MKLRSFPLVLGSAAALALAAAPAGAQVKAGPEFRANTYTTGPQSRPRVAMEEDGDFIVVWHSSQPGDTASGLFGQRYSRTGSPSGGEFQVNTYTSSTQVNPKIAINAKGDFVVVWTTDLQDGSSYGIVGQRFNSSGARVGGEFQVNTHTTGYQDIPGVAMDARGNFVVAWESVGQDGNGYGIFARRYDRNGVAQGVEFQVNTYTTGSQETVDVDMSPDGNRLVIVWESPQDGSSDAVVGQAFDGAGNRVGAEFVANTINLNAQDEAAVGVAADGSFVVVWETDFVTTAGQEIRAQLFDPAANRVAGEFGVNSYTTGDQYIYGISVDDQGNFVVVWDDYARDGSDWGAFGQRFNAGGFLRGPEFRVNTFTTDYQGFSFVKGDGVGNFVVAWQSDTQDGSGFGIFGQRFGGLLPSSLSVNTAGNRVWEPGETADVQPGWRNVNGAPQTFAGDLSGLTGPAGATYTLTDGFASYGTVANDAVGTCTSDCFGVSVDDPSPRPVQHWDASALEGLFQGVQDQQKRWTLHIGDSFSDVPSTGGFYRFVETLLHHGITGGCGGTNYCPASSTTREQMSVFVLIAKESAGYLPPACTTPIFTDVPASSPFCRFIEELFRRGVVGGCGPNLYCPANPVTREQMAVFVLRTLDPALNPPACGTPVFNDVPASSPFCRWIEELFRRGVVTGCGPGVYCPANPVTREQMGVFISITFGLGLYGP